MTRIALVLCVFTAVSVRGQTNSSESGFPPAKPLLKSSFHLYHSGAAFEETCALLPYREHSLSTCGYNQSLPLTLIIHGWTMNGLMEPWIFNLASALKLRLGRVNVLISDWRSLALQPYPIAAKNSRQVGRDVASLLQWLQEVAQLNMDDVHLIGYSLGAHVAGFAGSHFRGLKKVGRITGLDPAGPHFEGLPAFDRLSPDDAQFVDALHTFTSSNLIPGVGIKQGVAHVDFYPNGGAFQPGCKMTDIYSNVYQYGLQGVPKTIKCSHERAVRLFTDSLVNSSHPIMGYRCRDDRAFSRGLCLDCKQKRCNTLGFDVRRERSGSRAKGLFLKTGPDAPYRVFHYQIRVLLTSPIQPTEISLSVSLNGSAGETRDLPLVLHHVGGAANAFTSLASVALDLGQLTHVALVWSGPVWSGWWRNFLSWGGAEAETELSVWRIRIKAGETQEKTWFCGAAGHTHLKASEAQAFGLCRSRRDTDETTRRSHSTQSFY